MDVEGLVASDRLGAKPAKERAANIVLKTGVGVIRRDIAEVGMPFPSGIMRVEKVPRVEDADVDIAVLADVYSVSVRALEEDLGEWPQLVVIVKSLSNCPDRVVDSILLGRAGRLSS